MKRLTRIFLAASAVFCCALLLSACGKQMKVTAVENEFISIDSTLDAIQDSDYIRMLEPIRENMEQQLNIKIAVAPREMTRFRPECELLNWACDALAACARKYYDGEVDMAVVNAGGLRCDWAAGDITFRSVFELMPFDNELVVLTMKGTTLIELAENCVMLGGQGVSKEFRVTGLNGQLESVLLSGKPIDPDATYYVATSDYLSGGADGLAALTHFTSRHMTGKKIRDLYIEYIAEQQVVEATIDGRMNLIYEQ